jgi:L-gulonolactone oxidase
MGKGGHVVQQARKTFIAVESPAAAPRSESGIERHNWKGNLTYFPYAVAYAYSVDDIVRVAKDQERFPSPIRAAGSQHSTTFCIEANRGTVIDLTKMNKILAIDHHAMTITMQPGVLHIDAAKALEKVGLAFNVNIELGNATVGSIACCGTKDGSFPDGFGQVASYLVAAKLVLPSGELLEVTEKQPDLLRAVRSSFGMLGILYEVTFRVRRLQAMRIRHVAYSVNKFADELPRLIAESDGSMMLYLFPHLDKVVVEHRKYVDGEVKSHWQWKLRNWFWKAVAPGYARFVSSNVPFRWLRNRCFNTFHRINARLLTLVIRGKRTSPTDQIIRYPAIAGYEAYTFSIWAFPEREYPKAIRDYFQFCKDYYKEHGFRCNMLNVGYRIAKDTSSLFSYTSKEPMLTLDPVSTGPEGWEAFLDAYNQFCSEHHGRPLFNQTPQITPAQVKAAFGEEIAVFQKFRQQLDPGDRMYSGFFRDRLE